MQDVDVLVMPTRHTPPEPLSRFATVMGKRFPTRPFNVLGLPALCIGSGFTGNRLPLSKQIVGRPFKDALVLKVGDAFEKAPVSAMSGLTCQLNARLIEAGAESL